MKITLTLPDGTRHAVPAPRKDSPHADVDIACPFCGAAAPLQVAGEGMSIDPDHSRDTYRADARTVCCGADAGVLRVKMGTFFGLEEDETMLVHGRARVYR